jgi:hypothetical protein
VSPSRGAAYIVEREARALPLADAERAEWQAWARYMATRPGQPPRPEVEIPRTKPIIRELFADTEGRLWVNLYTRAARRTISPRPAGDARPLLTWREHNVYDVFDERGRYLGRVELPPASQLLAVSGNHLWLGVETEDGEPILSRYQLRTHSQ